jgi:hypothetical protein
MPVSSPTSQFVCLYGHFYQPPREDPYTGEMPLEPGAAPYANYNEKITAECYRPNAEAGNFEHISFDVGSTLASWLERAHPDVYRRILDADRLHVERYGVGNALAQAYNHTILPLATRQDKITQIRWGLADFAHRFGRRAEGMWLAETAVDDETLEILADEGAKYTVLAPWQAAEPIDPTMPYRVRLRGNRVITVFFYNGPLSAGVSFNPDFTSNADVFAATYLPAQLNPAKRSRGDDQLLLIASDGELYGHHKPWRDMFLSHLVREGATQHGFGVTTLGRYLRDHQPRREVRLRLPSAWSCRHGVARWREGCDCTEGDTSWKPVLRQALDSLAAGVHDAFVAGTRELLADPWAARDAYLPYYMGWQSGDDFWRAQGIHSDERPHSAAGRERVERLLEAEYFGQCMYTSCAFFFEDLDLITPRRDRSFAHNDIAFARRAISLVWQAAGIDLESAFVADLAAARSWRSGVTGADIYRQLPPCAPGELPSTGAPAA